MFANFIPTPVFKIFSVALIITVFSLAIYFYQFKIYHYHEQSLKYPKLMKLAMYITFAVMFISFNATFVTGMVYGAKVIRNGDRPAKIAYDNGIKNNNPLDVQTVMKNNDGIEIDYREADSPVLKQLMFSNSMIYYKKTDKFGLSIKYSSLIDKPNIKFGYIEQESIINQYGYKSSNTYKTERGKMLDSQQIVLLTLPATAYNQKENKVLYKAN